MLSQVVRLKQWEAGGLAAGQLRCAYFAAIGSVIGRAAICELLLRLYSRCAQRAAWCASDPNHTTTDRLGVQVMRMNE